MTKEFGEQDRPISKYQKKLLQRVETEEEEPEEIVLTRAQAIDVAQKLIAEKLSLEDLIEFEPLHPETILHRERVLEIEQEFAELSELHDFGEKLCKNIRQGGKKRFHADITRNAQYAETELNHHEKHNKPHGSRPIRSDKLSRRVTRIAELNHLIDIAVRQKVFTRTRENN